MVEAGERKVVQQLYSLPETAAGKAQLDARVLDMKVIRVVDMCDGVCVDVW